MKKDSKSNEHKIIRNEKGEEAFEEQSICDNKHRKKCWFWKFFIIYRMLLNKKLYMECFATGIDSGMCQCS